MTTKTVSTRVLADVLVTTITNCTKEAVISNDEDFLKEFAISANCTVNSREGGTGQFEFLRFILMSVCPVPLVTVSSTKES